MSDLCLCLNVVLSYTGKLLLNLMDHTDIVRDLTFAPDGSLVLVSASRDKTLRVWDLKDDGERRALFCFAKFRYFAYCKDKYFVISHLGKVFNHNCKSITFLQIFLSPEVCCPIFSYVLMHLLNRACARPLKHSSVQEKGLKNN